MHSTLIIIAFACSSICSITCRHSFRSDMLLCIIAEHRMLHARLAELQAIKEAAQARYNALQQQTNQAKQYIVQLVA